MQLFNDKKHLDTEAKFLVEQSIKGNRNAQKRIFDSLSGKMMALCLRYMGDRESAEDVLQNGFVTLFTKLDTYSGEGSFEGWARRIFVNTALMTLRKKDALRQSEEVEAARDLVDGEPSPIQNIGAGEILELVSKLPPGFRTVFNMYVVEGYSHKEIAESLGISENTSRSQLQRARTMLQKEILKLY